MTIYFTVPQTSGFSSASQTIENAILNDITNAKHSIDCAIYSFTVEEIAHALVSAHQHGITVRVVMESDNMNTNAVSILKNGGIPILGDQAKGLMHNKFLVVDNYILWTGSLNLTYTGFGSDNNNFVRFDSADLAGIYENEFNEMFEQKVFGAAAIPNEQVQTTTVAGDNLSIYFSPENRSEQALVDLVENAQTEIDFLAFSFTSDALAEAILQRAKDGIIVGGVFDLDRSEDSGGQYDHLRRAGLKVRLDGNPGLMHEKVMVIDSKTIAFGSYNYTEAARTQNDENLLIFTDASAAGAFEREFHTIYNQATP